MNAIKSINQSSTGEALIKTLPRLESGPIVFGEKIVIPCAKGMLFYDVNDIMYLKADSNYCMLFLSDGSHRLFSKTLKYMSSFLPVSSYIKVHQSYLVNKHLIKSYHVEDGCGSLELLDKTKVPVSRSCKKMFSKK